MKKCENVKMLPIPIPFTNWNWKLVLATMATVATFSAFADAGVVEETVTVAKGWNAVYIESTPESPGAAAFFADLSVTKASCYLSSVYASTAQLAGDGKEISQKPVSHLVYDLHDEVNSTLKNIVGGQCYFLYATNAAEKTFLGVPQLPHVSWQASAGGFATFAPVSAPKGESVLSTTYFGEGPCGATHAGAPQAAWGTDPVAPSIGPLNAFNRKPKVEGGKVYAFESDVAGEWPGVIDVATDIGGFDFSDGVAKVGVTVRNAGTQEREVRLSLADSAREGDARPQLYLYIPPGAASRSSWTQFASTNAVLSAGESRTFIFQCDKSAMTDGVNYAAVLAVEDLSGTKMRVRLPVSAAKDAAREGVGAYPAGLWIGQAQVMQVSDVEGNLKNAGGAMKGTLLLHVDGSGRMTLLQRVAVAQVQDEDGAWRTALYRDLGDVPRGTSARRVSSVFIDTANRATQAGANTDASASEFGREATFRFTVGERSKENPFRHAWHPDHDGRKADYSADSPSGDVPANFIGSIKPESFSVTNQIAFVWADDNGRSTYSRTPEETTFGRLDWKLTGLTKHPIMMRGLFTLKRVSDAVEIKEEE